MSDEPRRLWAWIAFGIVATAELYILSIGPVVAVRRDATSWRTIRVVYRPLFWAGEQSESFERALNGYQWFCIDALAWTKSRVQALKATFKR
jgi:hypothetical protein